MKRKFRTKRNVEYTLQERRLNLVSTGIFILGSLLFFVFGYMNTGQGGYGSIRNIGGLMAITSLLLTIGLAMSYQLSVKLRLTFSLLVFLFSILSQFQIFFIYSFLAAAFLSLTALIHIGTTYFNNSVAAVVPKKYKS